MKNLLSIAALSIADVERIFSLARNVKAGEQPHFAGLTCAYSFEGNSLRTRATFIKAMTSLGLGAVELPNLLKTQEDKRHLAGYMDQWVDIYVIRESNHAALERFAGASQKPVINAMSALGHPCEILSDAFSLRERFGDLRRFKFCIVGPSTNVLRSWREFCELFGLEYRQVVPRPEDDAPGARMVLSLAEGLRAADIILTDAWPQETFDPSYQVTLQALQLASPTALVIPCPPFDTAREVHAEVIASPYFAGYEQKQDLYAVQKAILVSLLGKG